MKNYGKKILILLFSFSILLFSLRLLHRAEAESSAAWKRGWPAAITWEEPYVGYVNIFCKVSDHQAPEVKLFIREEGAFFFLPSMATGRELRLDYDERDFEVWKGGERLGSGSTIGPALRTGDFRDYEPSEAKASGEEIRIVYISDAYGRIEKNYELFILCSENLPLLAIDTQSHSLDMVDEDKANREGGNLRFFSEEGELTAAARIRELGARGQSSFEVAKKNYRAQLAKETEIPVLGRVKGLTLTANALDASKQRNALAFDLAGRLGLGDTAYVFADAYFNGEYRGIYMLTRPLDEAFDASSGAVSGSFLLETETWEERLKSDAVYMKRPQGLYLEYVRPRLPGSELEQTAQSVIDRVDDEISSLGEDGDIGGLYDIAGVDSFVSMYLMNMLTNDIDSGQHSSFLWYDASAGLLHLGPVWDYDKAFGNQKRVNSLPGFEAYAHSWPEELGRNRSFGQLAAAELEDIRGFLEEEAGRGLEERSQWMSSSWNMDRLRWGSPVSSVADEGSLEGNTRQLSEWFKSNTALCIDRLEHPEEWCRIYFESEQGRALCKRKGESLGRQEKEFLEHLYGCSSFEPDLEGMLFDGDIVAVPVK